MVESDACSQSCISNGASRLGRSPCTAPIPRAAVCSCDLSDPLLLAFMGVWRFRITDIYDKAGPVARLTSSNSQFGTSLLMLLPPRLA